MSDTDDGLSRDEEEALRAMKRDECPPPRIEHAIVDALRRDGLIAPQPRQRWPLLAAAAAVVAFIAGMNVPHRAPRGTESSQPRFVLLLYSGETRASRPGHREEYAAWARRMASQGTPISGEELADGADEDGPRGFFIVGAPDVDAARRIAATCPHVRYGGRIVVRRIVS